jgi:Protein of unknown function (DUF4231)
MAKTHSHKKVQVPLVDTEALKAEIDELNDLDEQQKRSLENRWLHMVRYWDERSRKSRRKYFAYRTIVLIGGVLIPALVTLQTSALVPDKYKGLIQFAAIVTGLLIAIAAGIEEIFHYGDIWREKRNAAELLKIEGWRYLQLARPYRQATHEAAYSDFAANVELLIEREIKDYMVVTQPAEKGEIQKLIGQEIAEYMKQNRPNKPSHQHPGAS